MRQTVAQSSPLRQPHKLSILKVDHGAPKSHNWTKETTMPEKLSEGTQILREYIFYNKFDFMRACSQEDGLDKGILQPHTFKYQLRKSNFEFLEKHILEIYEDAPKDYNLNVKYRSFWLGLKKLGKPDTFLCFRILKAKHNSSPILDFDTILSNDFFAKKRNLDFHAFGLNDLDLEMLWSSISGREDGRIGDKIAQISEYNNEIILKNFKVKISAAILNLIRTSMGYARDYPLADGDIQKGLGIKKYEIVHNIDV